MWYNWSREVWIDVALQLNFWLFYFVSYLNIGKPNKSLQRPIHILDKLIKAYQNGYNYPVGQRLQPMVGVKESYRAGRRVCQRAMINQLVSKSLYLTSYKINSVICLW